MGIAGGEAKFTCFWDVPGTVCSSVSILANTGLGQKRQALTSSIEGQSSRADAALIRCEIGFGRSASARSFQRTTLAEGIRGHEVSGAM